MDPTSCCRVLHVHTFEFDRSGHTPAFLLCLKQFRCTILKLYTYYTSLAHNRSKKRLVLPCAAMAHKNKSNAVSVTAIKAPKSYSPAHEIRGDRSACNVLNVGVMGRLLTKLLMRILTLIRNHADLSLEMPVRHLETYSWMQPGVQIEVLSVFRSSEPSDQEHSP